MEIRELRAFVTVVDEGGPSAAARKLHVSQSALSQTVQTLERQHAASSAQLAMLKAGDLEVALVRDRRSDPFLDSVLAVEEAMGVILTAGRSAQVSLTNPAIGEDDRPVPPEVKLAAVGTGRTFAFASPGWARPLPHGLIWHPLLGNPIVRRTWAAWPADSREREIATLLAALDMTR